MAKFNVGVIGLGARGGWWIRDILCTYPNVEVTALCDVYEDRLEKSKNDVLSKTGKAPALLTTDYKELISSPLVNTVLVFSSWDNHFDAALRSMEAGKPVGIEVGGAYNIDQCFELVKTHERTGTPIMLLENCCYGEIELTVTHMVRQGVLGNIVHCEGGYHHDLRHQIGLIEDERHYRHAEYKNRNCENYPTHELGPIAKLLNINNGNRFVSLVSMASKSQGMTDYLTAKDSPLASVHFAQGDIFTTLIKCANGETIKITLDTTLPRFYSRNFTVRGTKGLYEEATNSVFLDAEHSDKHFDWKPEWNNMEKYMEDYRHPLWKEYREGGIKGGHGGMDYLVISAFFEALENNTPMPIDVYDAAAWMAITALSEESAALGSQPVLVPDFTHGQWKYKKAPLESRYNLR